MKDYARILADLAMRRELIRIGEDIVNTAFEAPIEIGPAAQIEEAEKALYRVAERGRFGEGPLDFDVALAQAVRARSRRWRAAATSRASRPVTPISMRCSADCTLPT